MSKSTLTAMVMACLVLGVWRPLLAADAKRGQELHDKSCMTSCHASRVKGPANTFYLRDNRKDSLAKLRSQVAMCNQNVLNSEWFPEDEEDVVEYLNQEFYHFKKDQPQ